MSSKKLSTSFGGKRVRLKPLTFEYLTEYQEENNFKSLGDAVDSLIPKKNKKKRKPFNIDALLDMGT